MFNKKQFRYVINAGTYNFSERIRGKIVVMLLRKLLRKKIRRFKIFKTIKKDKKYLQKSREYLSKSFLGYRYTKWHFFYSVVSGQKDVRFIPEDLFITKIEPTLNECNLVSAYTDKALINNFIRDAKVPNTLYRYIYGRYIDNQNKYVDVTKVAENIKNAKTELIVKPAIFSGGGKDIQIYDPSELAEKISSKKLFAKGSYVIQEKIEQHPEMAKFHPSSVNTCRIMTARIENEIVLLTTFFRMGRNKSFVDNAHAGGVFCGVDKSGKISDYALTNGLEKFYEHPNTHVKFKNFVIPEYTKMVDQCKKCHLHFLRFTIISWDVALDTEGEPVIIEYNLYKQSIKEHQVINGPLFGEYTDYLVNRFNELYTKDNYYI